MAQQQCTAEQAFNLLVAASHRSNQQLRDVTASIVAGVQSD